MPHHLTINNRLIGDSSPVFIIAEAGINHNGDIDAAKKLIDVGKKTGTDAIKFQLFKTEEFCNKTSSYYPLFKSLEFSDDQWAELVEHAKQLAFPIFASVFGKWSVDLSASLNLPIYKISSGDLTNFPLIEYIIEKHKPALISTGISNLTDVSEVVDFVNGRIPIALFHCISSYPARIDELNLSAIPTMKRCFDLPVGFSDHSQSKIASIVAVTLGANMLEKHFTLDKNMAGPDHLLSLDPKEMTDYVSEIRAVEKSIGNGIKKIAESEREMLTLARRSIYAKIEIKQGESITENSIKFVRPAVGIPPKYCGMVLGATATRRIFPDEPITWNDICLQKK